MTNRMRRRTDGKRLVGRYIRSDDARILNSVVVSPFSFEEIREAPVCYTDNINSNVILHELHDKEVLTSAVRSHETFDKEFRKESDYRPILQPLDFTEDWEKQRARMSARRDPLYDDDEEFDLEKELAAASAKKAAKAARESQTDENQLEEESSSSDTVFHAEVKPGQLSSLSNVSEETIGEQSEAPVRMSMDDVGREIKKFADVEVPSDGSLLADSDALATPDAEVESDHLIHSEGSEPTSENSEDFIAMPTSVGDIADDPEVSAANEYRRRVQVKEDNKQVLQELQEEAKANGYTDGYRDGEEKAAIQAQEQNRKILANLSELAGELEVLKKNVLGGVEENFYEVCQALAESLFRREFQINPEAFAQVMRRAVDEAVDNDQVRIRVNPESFKSLSEVSDKELTSKLVEDDSVPVGDFKLESSLSVVDGNIRDMIKKLMDQVNLSLFDENEKNRAS